MLFRTFSLPWVIVIAMAASSLGIWGGYRIGLQTARRQAPEVAQSAPPKPAGSTPPKAKKALTDAEIDQLISSAAEDIKPEPSPFGPTSPADPEAQARQRRWESMSIEKRQLLRKSLFTALAKVEGLEEVGDAIRQGKVDPRQFRIDAEAIADRMEFYTETMDSQAIEAEVTSTLQGMVDQVRGVKTPVGKSGQ